MIYYVDIDNTICQTEGNNYESAIPDHAAINKINDLYEGGHRIVYYSSRGQSSGRDWTAFTYDQLRSWGCLFHSLNLQKPSFDLIIDDKAIKIEELGTYRCKCGNCGNVFNSSDPGFDCCHNCY